MKLEAALKHFSPQGMLISDSVKGTSPDRITGTDVMAAIGTTSSRARFGLAAFFGKAGISKTDAQLAVQALARHAMDVAPKNVRKAAGDQFGTCMLLLAQYAFAEYSRSAATSCTCITCNGTGRATRTQTTRKVSYPWGKAPYWANRSRAVRPSDWEKWTEITEIVPAICDACEGKGVISARCRCGGRAKCSIAKLPRNTARQCTRHVNVAEATDIRRYRLQQRLKRSLNKCPICTSGLGPETGSLFTR